MIQRTDLEIAARFGGTVRPYDEIPLEARQALDTYYGQYDVDPTGRSFGYVVVPMSHLLEHVAGNHDLRQDWGTDWASYAAWYASYDDVPDHGDSVWPVLLSSMDEDRLEDGWHRFHSYVKKGLAEVPCIYVP